MMNHVFCLIMVFLLPDLMPPEQVQLLFLGRQNLCTLFTNGWFMIRGTKVGTKSAEIWTVVDQDVPGFRDLSEAFTNWEDVWD